MLINSVRGHVKSLGGRLPRRNPGYFHTLGAELPEALRAIPEPTMAAIAPLNEKIRAYDRQIDKLIEDKYPEAAHLGKVGGVGPITGLTYVLTVEDPGRFHRSRDVGRTWGSRAGGARAGCPARPRPLSGGGLCDRTGGRPK